MQNTLFILIGFAAFMGGFMFLLFRWKRREPLTYINFLFADPQHPRYIHLIGPVRVMPDDGESFDIFHHLLFDTEQKKFISGGHQRGKDIELRSPFVQRSLEQLRAATRCDLQLPGKDLEEGFDEDHQPQDAVFSIYQFEDIQSDTETLPSMKPDSLVFIKQTQRNGEYFRLLVYRNGRELQAYTVHGMHDYYFRSIYLHDRKWFCFTYRKQKDLMGGMGLCILDYESGVMIFNDFIRNP